MDDKFLFYSAVYVILKRDGKIAFLRRFNTGWMDGSYTLPAGHVEEGETAFDTAVREAKEETGVSLKQSDVRVVHVSHRRAADRTYFDIYVMAETWEGEPRNTEPEKCDDLNWFPITEPPSKVLPYIPDVLDTIDRGEHYSSSGF